MNNPNISIKKTPPMLQELYDRMVASNKFYWVSLLYEKKTFPEVKISLRDNRELRATIYYSMNLNPAQGIGDFLTVWLYKECNLRSSMRTYYGRSSQGEYPNRREVLLKMYPDQEDFQSAEQTLNDLEVIFRGIFAPSSVKFIMETQELHE
jgi:hypothetical protein